MYKFEVNENGYYLGYSKNGTIPMNEEYTLNNEPTDCHHYDGTTWVLDSGKQALLSNKAIYAEIDLLQTKSLKNEFRYKNDAKYGEYKLKYEAELLELENRLK